MGDESNPKFSGAVVNEVWLEDTPQPDLVCLVNHFQGRAHCPYGQTQADLALPATDPKRCTVADAIPVEVPVKPQLVGRRDASVVYLSCRCDGPQANASYCACPSGFACAHLIDAVGLNEPSAGSYCIRDGTKYDESVNYGPTCDRTAPPGDPANCG